MRTVAFGDIRQMTTFPPFGRPTVCRRGVTIVGGQRACVRDFDGVQDVEA